MDEEEEEIINPFEEVDFEEGLGPQPDDFDPNFDVLDVVEAIGTQNPEYDFYSAEGEAPGTIDKYDVAFLQAGEPSLAAQEIMGGYEAPELSSIVPERLQGVWSLTEALGTVNPDLNVFGDDLITGEDIVAFGRGIPFARDYYGGYGVSPDEIEESETYGQAYAGYVPTEGIDSLQYLFGPQSIPPGLEKTFFDVERDPFRQDWSEGAFVPYYYDLGEMSEVDQDLYRNSESFLSDLGERASASGFDDINLYLMSLSSEDPVEFSRQRDLYNYFAPIYEELGPRYRAIQQESFQESLRSPEMRDYLQTPEGSRDIVQSIGILAAASGIDPSRLTSQDVSALLDIIGTGGLDSLIYGNETTGPRFSVVSSDDGGSTTVSQKIVDQNGNDIIRVEDGQIKDAVTNETLELDPITGTIDILDENGNKAATVSLGEDGSIEIDEVSGPDPSNTVFDDPPGQTTGGPGPDQQYQATPGFDRGDISYFYDVNDFSEGYEFLRFVSPDGFRYNPDADIESGEYGVSFGDFSLRSGADEVRQYDQIYGNNPIMGYNPDVAPINWSELDTLPGESSQIISGFASETATINGGKSEDSVSLVQYPAFLVSAVNDNEPSLMRVSGGDPYAWWESLSTSDRLKFESAYSGEGEDVVYVDVEDPTADIFNRDESGKITEYLMPMWMVKKQLVSKDFGDEVDHKMWSHLSASARNELQEKAASDSQTITGEDLKLVPVMRVSDDGTIETATFNYGTSSEDDAVIIFPDPQQKSTSVRIEPNIDKLTFGQFAKVVADSGFDNTFVDHADYMSEATKELVRNDLGDNRAWESFHNTGRNRYEVRGNFEAKAASGDFARNTTYKGSRNSGTSANRNDWPNFDSPWHGTAFPDGLFDYVINNIDNFRDATGGDVYAVPIRASGDPDIEIGSVQDWTPGGVRQGAGNRRYPYGESFKQIDIDGEKVLSGIDNETSSQYQNVKTLGDIKNADPIDWGVFLAGAGDAEEDDLTDSQRAARDGGWEGIYNTDWIPFGKEDVDEYGNDIQYYPIKDPASDVGGVYFGIEEWMLQVGRMYQAYSNAIDNRPASTLNEKKFYEDIIGQKQKTYESPDGLSFDEIENMDERKRLQKQWSEETDSDWLSELIRVEGAYSGDNFSDLFGGFEAPYPLFVPADFETESLYSGGIVGVSDSPGHTGDFEFSGGGYVPGVQGGMDDTVPAVTDGSSLAKLSSGEFVIPADVVSGLGDGNNANGAQKLYEMMDRIRSFKTGSPVQPPPIDESMVLPE
tara:strand:+ start:872 stop:4666 length:3795 start_codon:yes stop_codon:yes gene_type:complete